MTNLFHPAIHELMAAVGAPPDEAYVENVGNSIFALHDAVPDDEIATDFIILAIGAIAHYAGPAEEEPTAQAFLLLFGLSLEAVPGSGREQTLVSNVPVYFEYMSEEGKATALAGFNDFLADPEFDGRLLKGVIEKLARRAPPAPPAPNP